jgi:hypothetical protein
VLNEVSLAGWTGGTLAKTLLPLLRAQGDEHQTHIFHPTRNWLAPQ